MPAKLSKEVTDRMREGRYVLSAFDTEGGRIAEMLSPSTQSNLEATSEEAGYSSVLVDLRRNMSTALDGLVGADGVVSAAAACGSRPCARSTGTRVSNRASGSSGCGVP